MSDTVVCVQNEHLVQNDHQSKSSLLSEDRAANVRFIQIILTPLNLTREVNITN